MCSLSRSVAADFEFPLFESQTRWLGAFRPLKKIKKTKIRV